MLQQSIAVLQLPSADKSTAETDVSLVSLCFCSGCVTSGLFRDLYMFSDMRII